MSNFGLDPGIPPYIVHTIPSYLLVRTFETYFQTSQSRHAAEVSQCGLISPVHFSLYVNNILSTLYHVEVALYANDTAIITTSHKPTLLVCYLEAYLNDLQRWLSD